MGPSGGFALELGAFVPIGVFAVVLTSVGVKLVRLWHHTRALPELVLGAGIVLLSLVAMPLTALGRLPGAPGTALGQASFAMGMALLGLSLALLFVFTWLVFRRESVWARAAVAASAVAALGCAMGAIHANLQGSTVAEILPHARRFNAGLVVLVALHFAWGGVESLLYRRVLLKRLALGLADPVVVNRFLLWAVGAAVMVVLCTALLVCIARGLAIAREPVPLAIIAAAGTVMSATWYLTFFAPAWYRAVLGRAAAPAAAVE
jgi:hypothetical protein